jgi:hypothetical protein
MDDGVQQQTECIDQNMPLLALDQLAGIEAMRIDAGPPCMGLTKSSTYFTHSLLPSSFIPVSLFDLESRFFAPTRSITKLARAGAVKVGRRPNLAAHSALARPHLDCFEHDGTLGAVGMTIRGEPALRARINRATTLYPVGP